MKKYFPLVLILILAAALRFYHNLDISIWHDEAFSALMIKYPWHEMFYRLGLDVHPPAYYIALRLWHNVFGDSVVSLRGFSILFGVAGVWAAWLFVKTAFLSQKMALWTALLAAINPFIIQFSTEARMYTFGAFFALLAAYFLTKYLHFYGQSQNLQEQHMPNMPEAIHNKKKMWWNLLGFTACAIIIIYTHYYLFFTAAALGFYGLLYLLFHRGNWKKYLPFLFSLGIIVLSFLPWLKVFISQLKSVGGGYWIPAMDIWSIPGTFWTILLGLQHNNANPTTRIIMALVLLFSGFVIYQFLRKSQAWEKWLVALCVVAPFCGAILFMLLAHLKGSKSSVYEERYFLYAAVFFVIALAAWLSEMKIKWLSASVFVAYCLFNIYAFAHYWGGLNIPQHPGMAAAAKFLGANVEPGHHVYLGTSFEFFNLKYYDQAYYHFPAPPLLYTGGRNHASQMSSVEGSAMLADQDLVPTFSQPRPGDTVWLVWTYAFGSSRPGLPENWTRVDEKEYPDVRPYAGATIYVDEYKVN